MRPFVLTRATFAGGQRYAAVWPGDNSSAWSDLRSSIPMLLGMGLSGLGFSGVDIGGFMGAPSAELYTRWLQAGVFYPFMRTHTGAGTPDQEPWSFGTRHEQINRRAIELRYWLLPHVYNEMRQASETGIPALRPLLLEYPEDPDVADLDQQFLFGRDLLVAPVLEEGAAERWLYLPAGEWYDFETGERLAGGDWIRREVTLESLPIFVRGGGFVFTQDVVQHTGEMPAQSLQVSVYPAASSQARLYEDDGETLDYRRGVYRERSFRQERSGETVVIEIGAARGSYQPAARDLILRVRSDAAPSRVLAGAETLPEIAADGDPAALGWRAGGGFVTIRLADGEGATRIVIE